MQIKNHKYQISTYQRNICRAFCDVYLFDQHNNSISQVQLTVFPSPTSEGQHPPTPTGTAEAPVPPSSLAHPPPPPPLPRFPESPIGTSLRIASVRGLPRRWLGLRPMAAAE